MVFGLYLEAPPGRLTNVQCREPYELPDLEIAHILIAFIDTVIRLETRLAPEIPIYFGHASLYRDGIGWQEGQGQG